MTSMKVATVSERPDLIEVGWEQTSDTLPEYNSHGDVLGRYWPRLTEERPEFQFHLVGEGDEILARARSIPVRWDGTVDDLPAGIDGAIARGFDEGGANVLCALVIMIPRHLQGRGLSARTVTAMLEVARRHDLASLIAPVRPSWKERYPLVPIERYASWRPSLGRSGSAGPSRSGRNGRGWPSLRAASTGSRAGSRPWRSIARQTGAATGSR